MIKSVYVSTREKQFQATLSNFINPIAFVSI